MNDMEKFLNFGAVVKVRRFSDDELYNFIKLMKSMGFLNEYIDSFEKNCCYDKEFQEFSNSAFWDLVEMNRKNSLSTCIEFQWGKGFTFGDEKQKTININGKPIKNKANIIDLHSYSSHMQRNDLLNYYKSIRCEKIYLVHSDKQARLEFKEDLENELNNILKTTHVVCVNKGVKIKL